MPETRSERGTCRFVAAEGQDGKPVIRVELFHGTVSVPTHATLNFNLLGGLSLGKAKKMAETVNDSVLGIFPSPCPATTLCLRNRRSELLEYQEKKLVVRIASSMNSSIRWM